MAKYRAEIAHSDTRQARALARLIRSSESAIDAYLTFGLAEAQALIIRHRAAVLAIANALIIHKTLNAVEISRDHRPRAGARAAGRLGADVRERVIV